MSRLRFRISMSLDGFVATIATPAVVHLKFVRR
jgi:hypothetical protein